MNERTFVLKGTICHSNSLTELSITENGYLVCEDGRCAGVFDELPEKFAGISCTDFGSDDGRYAASSASKLCSGN